MRALGNSRLKLRRHSLSRLISALGLLSHHNPSLFVATQVTEFPIKALQVPQLPVTCAAKARESSFTPKNQVNMPVGSISSSPDTVGVCVVNYRVPICETQEEVYKNCERICQTVEGLKRGYPGLDLVIFPEYSTQGLHPTKWGEYTTTLDGKEVQMFKEACVKNGVYGIFSLTGEEHPEGLNPYNTLIMITDQGEINLVYRKMFPWTPVEPWTAGHETAVAVGPKGLIVGGTICYDCNLPEIVRDTVFKGAELVIRIQGYMYPAKQQQIDVAKVRAWENNTYFAVSNLSGRDLVYSYFGHSNIIGFDGVTLAECGTAPEEATYAELSLSAIRNARRNWTAENHLYNLVHRGYTSEPRGHAACPFDFYKTWVERPEEAAKLSEQLTRDADSPLKCTYEDAPVMMPSKLAQLTLHADNDPHGRTGVGLDGGKHGFVNEVTTEEAGRWAKGKHVDGKHATYAKVGVDGKKEIPHGHENGHSNGHAVQAEA